MRLEQLRSNDVNIVLINTIREQRKLTMQMPIKAKKAKSKGPRTISVESKVDENSLEGLFAILQGAMNKLENMQ